MARTAVIAFAATLALLAASLPADVIWIGGLQIKDTKVLRVEQGNLVFTTAGREASRELSRVTRLQIDGENAFNAAEEAFASGNWDQAADGYQRTVRSTNKDWLKEYSTLKLLEAANKSGRFDAAVTAYVNLLLRDPASAGKSRPALPDEKSTYLDTAVSEVNDALKQTRLSDEQRMALLSFLIDLHNARNDARAAEQAAEKLDEILAKNPNDPNAGRALARRKLQSASQALQAGNFPKAAADIEQNKPLFTEPQQQAEALWILAEAKFNQADKGNAGNADNATALKDAALAYMRIVAHFKGEPGRPRVGDALLRTAEIHERLNELPTATALYQQVAAEFNDDPAGTKAKQALDRLKTAAGQSRAD